MNNMHQCMHQYVPVDMATIKCGSSVHEWRNRSSKDVSLATTKYKMHCTQVSRLLASKLFAYALSRSLTSMCPYITLLAVIQH